MDELVISMEKLTKNMTRLTLQHYVFKKNVYNHHFVHRYFDVTQNKLIYCNSINIVSTLIGPVLKYGPYHINSFEKKLTPISNLLVKISRNKLKIFYVGDRKNVFELKMSAQIFFVITLQQIVILTQKNFK